MLLKIGIIILIILAVFFLLTFLIYLLNLDMKGAVQLTKLMNRYYDWRQKKRKSSDGR